ncbi:MAG: hypothetical protein HY903_09610 [Deltaproteobacteria bacterium]|nr:hypothetical protein [Deltaproteobacteria bacterium]
MAIPAPRALAAPGANPGPEKGDAVALRPAPGADGKPGRATPGALKAALWLLSADEELAAQTLGLLGMDEVRRLREATAALGRVSAEQLAEVHQDFRRSLEQKPLRVRGSADYLSRLAVRAFGPDKAAAALGTPNELKPGETGGALRAANAEELAILLAAEHPQVTAAVLASMEATRAAALLKGLPVELRKDVLDRIAKLTQVPRTALAQVERALGADLPKVSDDEAHVDGVRTAALLLNQLPPNDAEEVLEALRQREEAIATAIRRAMFTFDDLASLERRDWQLLLKEVQRDQLMPALKSAGQVIRDKVFGALSKRAAEMLKDDLDVMGPVRLADVEQARQAVVDVALRLRTEGRIAGAAGAGEKFV